MGHPRRSTGISLRPVDLNAQIAQLSHPPVIVNTINMVSPVEREKLKSQMFTYYDDTSLEIVPSCKGNHMRGDAHVGKICKICNTEVVKPTEETPESTLWLEIPRELAPVLAPITWTLLSKVTTFKKCDMLSWFICPTYRPPNPSVELTRYLDKIKAALPDLKRGIVYFYHNFDKIWEVIYSINGTKGNTSNKKLWAEASEYIRKYRKVLFTRYIPFPSRLLFVIESTAYSSYADKRMFDAFDALNTVAGLDTMQTREQEKRISRCLAILSTFYAAFFRDVLGKKEGMFRGHVFAGRGHFTARAVITSITGAHAYDEIELPWGVSIKLLQPHICNRLINRYGFSAGEALKYIREYSQRYSDIISDIFDDLIRSSKHKGIPVVLQRNPSLDRLSMQQLYVSAINRDPYSATIKMSSLILSGPNADPEATNL